MTQIISVITKGYALLASDRRLIYADGPKRGELFDDDTCKLISVCNFCGIGYSGLAKIEGCATHEWVAKTLASAKCSNPRDVSLILPARAGSALSSVRSSIRHQIFLMAGWWFFDDPPVIRSHFCVMTNALDESGGLLVEPRKSFDYRLRALRDEEEFLWHCIGQPIRKERAQNLERNVRRLIAREIGPKEALRLLVDEIVYTSTNENCASVGSKVLAFCIPKQSVLSQVKTGQSVAIAKLPDESSATFTYFEPSYSELRQYGPTFVCGEFAATDIQTENDLERDYQSSQMKILSLPKKET